MAEYIDREALIAEIDDRIANIGFTSPYQDDITLMLEGMARVKDSVEDFPAADVVEVVHGEWVKDEGKDMKRCSCCGYRVYFTHNYCPNCGAKMDGATNGH